MTIRVNLGAGDRYAPGWVNVDHDSPYRKDVDADLRGPLPWKDRSIDQVYCGHVLEHLTRKQCAVLLRRLVRKTVHGGQILAVGPDLDLARQMIEDGTFDFTYHQLDSLVYGGQRWPGDEHQWETTTRDIMDLLMVAGWVEVTDVGIANVPKDWPVVDRVQRWQYAISAVAP